MTLLMNGFTHRDWLFNGHACSAKQYANLDWSKAYMDMGPSPAGNTGPYWHVPDLEGDCVHRLYPRILKTKWARLLHQAIREVQAKCSTPAQ